MADVQLPSVATATPAAADTVAGVQGGAVKRFAVSNLAKVGSFTQAGAGAVARTVEDKLREAEISVVDFGAVGDGATDDTAAFHAAISALPNEGGTVIAPGGLSYAVNITINRPKVRLVGGGIGRVNSATYPAGLTPYDPTLPVITISDDTQQNEGVCLENLELNGQGAGYYGLKMLGGSYSQFFTNLTIQGFTKKSLWIESGATYPCSYLYFTNLAVQPDSSAAMEHGIYLKANASSYLSATYFTNVRLSGVNFGQSLEVDGATIAFSSSWFELRDGHGVLLSKSGAVTPKLYGNLLLLDSSSSSDVLVSVPSAAATASVSDYLVGLIAVDGAVDLAGTLHSPKSLLHIPYLSRLTYPVNIGAAYFTDAANQGGTTQSIVGNSAQGRLTVNAGTVWIAPTGGTLRVIDADNATTTVVVQNSAGEGKIRTIGNNIELVPPVAAGAVKAGGGAWNSAPLLLGSYYLWVDGSGNLRIKSSAPASDTDGTVVGSQS